MAFPLKINSDGERAAQIRSAISNPGPGSCAGHTCQTKSMESSVRHRHQQDQERSGGQVEQAPAFLPPYSYGASTVGSQPSSTVESVVRSIPDSNDTGINPLNISVDDRIEAWLSESLCNSSCVGDPARRANWVDLARVFPQIESLGYHRQLGSQPQQAGHRVAQAPWTGLRLQDDLVYLGAWVDDFTVEKAEMIISENGPEDLFHL